MTHHLDSTAIEAFRKELLLKKEELEKELRRFATKDPNLKGDWDSRYPRTPGSNLEEAADEVEEYATRLDLEFTLEKRLKDVEAALEKIGKDTYGLCEQCQNSIEMERLKASPEAKLCGNCARTQR